MSKSNLKRHPHPATPFWVDYTFQKLFHELLSSWLRRDYQNLLSFNSWICLDFKPFAYTDFWSCLTHQHPLYAPLSLVALLCLSISTLCLVPASPNFSFCGKVPKENIWIFKNLLLLLFCLLRNSTLISFGELIFPTVPIVRCRGWLKLTIHLVLLTTSSSKNEHVTRPRPTKR